MPLLSNRHGLPVFSNKRAWKENLWLHGPPMKYIVEHVRRGLSDGFGRIKNRGGALG